MIKFLLNCVNSFFIKEEDYEKIFKDRSEIDGSGSKEDNENSKSAGKVSKEAKVTPAPTRHNKTSQTCDSRDHDENEEEKKGILNNNVEDIKKAKY